jgi:hypothetical protein
MVRLDLKSHSGVLNTYIEMAGYASLQWTGGTLYSIMALESSSTTIVGKNFAVDGNPASYGELVALSGTLAGTLASGKTIDTDFFQGGYDNGHTIFSGTITLVPEPSTALLLSLGLGGLALRRRTQH